MQSKILSRRDIEFLIYEWLQVDALCTRERFVEHTRVTFDAALDVAERIATDCFYPINRLLDTQEPGFDGERVSCPPQLKEAVRIFCEAGLAAAGHDYELGGMQLPCAVEKAAMAYCYGACVSATAYLMLTSANANLQIAHGSKQDVERFVAPLLKGRFFGTMCLSEPQAGSSLADIRTRAERQPDGSFRLFGNKMWISGGDHDLTDNIVHLVLAKIPDDSGDLIAGTKGISLFIVPKVLVQSDGSLGERNDVAVAGLNHKMGYRGISNCLLNFGEGRYRPQGRAGAVGYLLGEPQRGLACMFHMMNEARIDIGLGAAMLGYTAYLHALDYARSRPQGRPPDNRDARTPQIPIIEHADVRRMLLAQKAYVEGALALTLYCARLVDDRRTDPDPAQRRRSGQLLELLTPIAKSWPSQWCQEANSLAIQVHGGYGYTRDYNVEHYYRDQRLNPIHEGTHGIQAIDLLGRKVTMDDGEALREFNAVVARTAEQARRAGAAWQSAAGSVLSWSTRFEALVTRLHGAGSREKTLANASLFLEAFGHFVMAWVWLEQAVVASKKIAAGLGQQASERDFYSGKLQAARYFLTWELPKIAPMVDLLDSLDTTTLDMQQSWF